MFDNFVLEIECICFILGSEYIIVFIGYVISCLIFLVVSFGVLVFIVICIFVILGKVFKLSFGIINVFIVIVVSKVNIISKWFFIIVFINKLNMCYF